jgi:pyruvate dehydrogenase E2 component (dihydrolipoamide acetyltransferase)
MASYIEMPKLSDTMTEGTLVKWLKQEGDAVESGDILAEIETDKATMEMECFEEGAVHKILIPAGGKAPIGAFIAIILEEGEEPPTEADIAAAQGRAAGGAEPAAASGGSSQQEQPEQALSTSAEAGTGSVAEEISEGGRVKASPLARKIARQRGINLAGVRGSGPGGRILKADVITAPPGGAAAAAPAAAAAVAGGVPAIQVPSLPGDTRIPLSGMRRVIAERLLASKTQIPHFYLNIEVDAAPLMAARKQINESSEKTTGNKYSVNDFILKAAVASAVRVPAVNASWGGDAIIQHDHVGLSVAISVEEGLVTPVIREADTKSLLQISQEVKELAGKARNKKLPPDAFEGGTLTISNLGAWGVDSFSAIINPPQAVILSVGAIVKKPVLDDHGEVVAGLRMNIGLSGDHRVVDGAVAAEYLAEVRKLIEHPALMLV